MSAQKFIIMLFILISASGMLTACTGPDIPDDQMKIAAPASPTPSPTPAQISATPLTGKDLMIDQNQVTTTPATAPLTATLATIKTSRGDIKIKLYPESAPQTVQNFLQKAQSGYYQNLIFHRVEDWVIQGGDPLGKGTGGGSMPTELSNVPFKAGSVGVARGGDIKISNDAQFFICTKDCAWLTGQYTNFGEVVTGLDIVKQIQIGDKILSISYE